MWATIDESTPEYEQARNLTQQIFYTYDLKYEINEFEIIEISENHAKVSIMQTTTKITGTAFRDNILVSKNSLRKFNGQWKIVLTEIEELIYLN